ncbi:MAG: hypothetical protein LQ351_003621 [Letrouitia transgressa]|nr:MAG: hypothetical protein LQ351_003621 [Letrouitia transgressa]
MYLNILLLSSTLLTFTLAAFDARVAAAAAAAAVNGKVINEYSSIFAAEMTDPAFKAMATAKRIGNIPAPVANRQAIAYIQRIATATAPVPLPQFVSSLPKDQQAAYSRMGQSLSQRLATADIQVAKAAVSDLAATIPVNGTSINGTTAVNGTSPSNSTSPGRPKSSSSRKVSTTPPPQQPTANPAPAPAANTTDLPGFGNPAQPTGAMKAAGVVAVGLMGFAALL